MPYWNDYLEYVINVTYVLLFCRFYFSLGVSQLYFSNIQVRFTVMNKDCTVAGTVPTPPPFLPHLHMHNQVKQLVCCVCVCMLRMSVCRLPNFWPVWHEKHNLTTSKCKIDIEFDLISWTSYVTVNTHYLLFVLGVRIAVYIRPTCISITFELMRAHYC